MSEDPKGFAAGDRNLFRYCGGDPVNRVDPMGLAPVRVPDDMDAMGRASALKAEAEYNRATSKPDMERSVGVFRENGSRKVVLRIQA